MKKRFISYVLSIIVMNMLITNVYADTQQQYKGSITNENVLLQRAMDNVNDAPAEMVDAIKNLSKIFIDGMQIDTSSALITTQELANTRSLLTGTETGYVASLFVAVDFVETIAPDGTVTATPRAIHSKTEEFRTDAYISATIYYSTGSMNHGGQYVDYVQLTEFAGSFLRTDSSCQISNKKIRGGYSGYNLNSSRIDSNNSSWYTNSNSDYVSRSYISPPIEDGSGIYGKIWAESYCTITRYSQSWDVSVSSEYAFMNSWS